MSDFYYQMTRFKDQVIYLFQNPGYVKTELTSDHQLLVEVIGIILLICLLLLALLKPTSTSTESANASTLLEADPEAKKATPLSTTTIKKAQTSESQAWIKREPPSIHELSIEEEQALNQAMAIAGKQALAEVTGAPHQAEFFQSNEASEAAKKMFARQKTNMQAPPSQPASKLEFIILYFMAPRSQFFENSVVFQLLRDLGLALNDQRVFEYKEGSEVQFYVSSALKPGHFDVHSLDAAVPGLSFILDLKSLQNGKTAFNKMLGILHELSQHFKGDILDEYRQRMTQNSMSTYMARIKSFGHIQHTEHQG